MRRPSRALQLALAASLGAGRVEAAIFAGLGDLPGGPFQSAAYSVSADGTMVAGTSSVGEGIPFVCDEADAFRWTEATGLVALGPPGDGNRWYGYGISADGSTVVGGGGLDGMCTVWLTFRWTETGGHETLPFFGDAVAVSADGGVVVGTARTQQGERAVRWTPEGGSQALGVLVPGLRNQKSNGLDVTDDGALVVGWSSTGTRTHVPIRWTAASGMQALGDLAGRAQAVSPEGSCIAGRAAFGGPNHQAFLWTGGAGFVPLPYLKGSPNATPPMWVSDVSLGCAVVVGWAETGSYPSGRDAFLWSGATGMVHVAALLEAQGVDLTGWSLHEAWGASADGRTIVGTGVNPEGTVEGWIATVPEPAGAGSGLAATAALLATGARIRRARRAGGVAAGRARCLSGSRRL